MKNIFRIISFVLVLVFHPLTQIFASSPYNYDEVTIEELMQPEGISRIVALSFTSQEALGDFVYDVEENGLGEAVILGIADILLKVYPSPSYQKLSMSDVEWFYYTCSVARYNHFSELAKTQTLNPAEATQSYKKAVESLLFYKNNTFQFRSSRPDAIRKFLVNRYYVMRCLQTACQSILQLNKIEPSEISLVQNIAHLQIMASDMLMDYTGELVDLRPGGLDAETLNKAIPFLKLSMFSGYTALAYFNANNIKYAKSLRREIKQLGNQDALSQCNEVFEHLEREREILRKSSVISSKKGSGRLRKLREENLGKLIEERNQSFVKDDQENPNASFDLIKIQFHTLEGEIDTDDPNWNINFIGSLEDIEGKILNLEGFDNSCSNIYQSIYAQLDKIVLGNYIFNYFPMRVLTSFALFGDIQGAVDRMDAIKALYFEKYGHISTKLRCFSALIKNLNGEHSEWLELEAEAESIRTNERERTKERRRRKRQGQVALIKSDISQKGKKGEKPLRSLKEERVRRSNALEAIKAEDEGDRIDPYFQSAKDRKEAKLQRHKETEERRRQQKNEAGRKDLSDDSKVTVLPVNYAPTLEERLYELNESSDIPLRELYDLTGRPLEVDEEIEAGTWAFTRDQLQTYLEAMGCTYTHGKSGHKKLTIPSSMHVYQGDQLITIVSEFGSGAVVLPKWNKNYVPDYLKVQILRARDKLRALKILSLESQEY